MLGSVSIMTVALEFYLALILGVSGVAKANNSTSFAIELREQGLLHHKLVPVVSKVFPYFEIILAIMLATAITPLITAVLLVSVMVCFLCVKLYLYNLNYNNDCGCFGGIYKQSINIESIITSAILLTIALIHLWLVTWVSLIEWRWRVIISLLIFTFMIIVFIRGKLRRSAMSLREIRPDRLNLPVSNLHEGDIFPPSIGLIEMTSEAIVIVVSALCKPCLNLCSDLTDVNFNNGSLLLIVTDVVEPTANLSLPSQSRVVFDPERELFRTLGMRATPTALVFRNGRLINQEIGITVEWLNKYIKIEANI